MLNSFYDKFIFTNGLKFRHNNFFLINVPFVIAPVSVLAGLMQSSDDEFSKKLYSFVKDSVKKNLMKQLSLDFGFKREKLVVFLEEFFSASGWGSISNVNVDFSRAEAIVSVKDNPFVAFLNAPAKKPVDCFLRGIFAGLFSRAFEKDVDCVELHCSALGAENCEFIIKEQYLFDLSLKAVREQLEIEA